MEDGVIVGTAGHIDHGKSALVAALTGRGMDRLAEEQRRGITIELGFAPLHLGDGRTAGVVDVPGHEDFVRTMVAGASGIDVALLVVAADDGIMPQTVEHLEVLEQLRVPRGIPVVTKADLAEPEWLELLADEVRERTANSRVAFEAPVVVSARSGAGLDALRARLRDLADGVTRRREADLFRLPIDRAFSVAGAGTVVTGTTWSGSVATGDAVLILPGGQSARVRSVESFGRAHERSEAGARVALALGNLERTDVHRGDVLVSPEAGWEASRRLDVRLELAPGAPPLRDRARLRVHLGTAAVLARVGLAGPPGPDGRVLARLRLEEPLVARGGDRFVLRGYSPVVTLGGGEVLDPLPPPRSMRSLASLDVADVQARIVRLVERRPFGLAEARLAVVAGAPPGAFPEGRTPAGLSEHDGWLVATARLEALAVEFVASVSAHHAAHPEEPGLSLETLRRSLRGPVWLADAAIQRSVRDRRLRVGGGVAALPGFKPVVRADAGVVEQVVSRVAAAGFTPPSWAELAAELGPATEAALREAIRTGRLVAVERDRAWSPDNVARFTRLVQEVGRSGEVSPGALRDRTGASRKYLIPLLEWCDRQRVTIRRGDQRVLNPAVPILE
jgi:selenocysteine-specific elongation factor